MEAEASVARSPTAQLTALKLRLDLPDASEELFRALTAQAPVGVFVTDTEGQAVYTNERLCALTGLTSEQSVGFGWTAALHPDDSELVTAAWAKASRGGQDFALEYRFLRPDGAVAWVEGSACAVRDRRGAVAGWVGIVVDRTARRLSDERYLRLFENARDAVYVADAAGCFISVNRAAEQLTGFSRPELLAMNYFDLVAPEDADRARQILARRLAGGSEEINEVELIVKDGRRVFVEISARAVLEEGQPATIEAIARNTTDRHALEERLSHQAFHDALTGLPNRLLFIDRLDQAVARLGRDRHVTAVMMLDLDNFKLVNDSLGHAAGDELLRRLAPVFREAMRPSDTVARFGGDEFAFLIEGLESEHATVEVAKRILSAVAQSSPVAHGAQHVSGTIGIAFAKRGDDAEVLLRDADTAMYRAKDQERGSYQIFDVAMHSRVSRELQVRTALADAIDERELTLDYQPIVALPGGGLLGMEALVRWQHPQWGRMQPGEFIPIAEEAGLIVPLSRFVLARAARQASEWTTRFPLELPWGVAVNLSARELADSEFVDLFERTVREQGAEPPDLTVEVTERAFLDTANTSLAENLLGLHKLGVRLSLDDFGTGYSALASLQRFPFAVVKIDRLFVGRIEGDSPDAPITKAITDLAHALKMQVVAEGVETQAQADYLSSVGCDAAQGFYFARPQPPSAISRLLETGMTASRTDRLDSSPA